MIRFLDCVTVTGADDSVNPIDLTVHAARFPFLEFGILLSKKQIGSTRFPSLEWQVDAETHLFTEGRFDLGKVHQFAQAAEPWLAR
jgi:hypothetical protein